MIDMKLLTELTKRKKELSIELKSVNERIENLIKLELNIIGKYFIFNKAYIYVNNVELTDDNSKFIISCIQLYSNDTYCHVNTDCKLYIDVTEARQLQRTSEKEFNLQLSYIINRLQKLNI